MKYVALLRGINVGGKRKLKMETLRTVCANELGFQNVKTYIQSGNIVFESPRENASELSAELQKLIKDTFNMEVPCMVFQEFDFNRIIAKTPFDLKKKEIQEAIYFSLGNEALTADEVSKLAEIPITQERFEVLQNVIYILCPEQYHKSKLHTNSLEKKLGKSFTTRNFRTMNKIEAMLKS